MAEDSLVYETIGRLYVGLITSTKENATLRQFIQATAPQPESPTEVGTGDDDGYAED